MTTIQYNNITAGHSDIGGGRGILRQAIITIYIMVMIIIIIVGDMIIMTMNRWTRPPKPLDAMSVWGGQVEVENVRILTILYPSSIRTRNHRPEHARARTIVARYSVLYTYAAGPLTFPFEIRLVSANK